ncbi:MAG: hypothetical protein KTR24_07850 [Saprospiraceae bacterium]|nr:hypothetical protein [Saprospiraceae bacterium]
MLAFSASACQKEPSEEQELPETPEAEADFHVLFVGNSLTYYNSLPNLVKEEAAAKGKNIAVETLANANYGLEDHWNDGIVKRLIKSGTYDYVVIQQGPSSQPYGRQSLLEYGGLIKALCEQHDTKMAFFMVWPSRQYYNTFSGVIRNYTEAAQTTNSILCPVGSEWKAYFDSTNDFSYYGPDQFHPSREGSLVAARIIYRSLFND